MAFVCTRCALRLQRAADARSAGKRVFSSTPRTRHRNVLPKFVETSQPELDNVLASLRDKHLLPAALSKPERDLIFKPKNKQVLEDSPTTVRIGGEDIELQWIDRMRDIPSKKKLVPKAINLIAKGEKQDWDNLPALLSGLHNAKSTPNDGTLAKIVRLAMNNGRFGTVLQCLRQADDNGMTLKKDAILENVVFGLHTIAQRGGWSEPATRKALKDAKEVALQLEDVQHGSGTFVSPNDPRTRPDVIGVFLELSAIYAWKFQDGKDVDGKVKAYAERLLSNISGAEQLPTTEPRKKEPQFEILRGVPIWQGLYLAEKILGSEMPQPELANRVVQSYEQGLETIATALRAWKPKSRKEGSYAAQGLKVWEETIRA